MSIGLISPPEVMRGVEVDVIVDPMDVNVQIVTFKPAAEADQSTQVCAKLEGPNRNSVIIYTTSSYFDFVILSRSDASTYQVQGCLPLSMADDMRLVRFNVTGVWMENDSWSFRSDNDQEYPDYLQAVMNVYVEIYEKTLALLMPQEDY